MPRSPLELHKVGPGLHEVELELHEVELELVVGVETTLEAYAAEEGLFLLDTDGKGLYISGAMAIDANGDSTAVAVEPDAEGIRLVIPGDWLSTAAYPVLIDPLVRRWQMGETYDLSPGIAYDPTTNRALVAYTGSTGLYARLVNAEDGLTLHQTRLSMFPCGDAPSVIFVGNGRNEYLVACTRWPEALYWRVNADGYPVGSSAKLGYIDASPNAEVVDIASAGSSTGLAVWSDNDSRVWGQIISPDGTSQGTPFVISNTNFNRKPAVDYDATLEKYVVAWQRTINEQPGYGEIWAAIVSTSGSVETTFQVSDDPGKEDTPDVAYSVSTGQTLVVWASEETTGQVIQARRLATGSPDGPAFTVSQTTRVDQLPRVAGGQSAGWKVTWQRTVPDSEDEGNIWLSWVPGNAGSNLSEYNQELRATSAGETHPVIALRDDGVEIVAFEEKRTPAQNSAIIVMINTDGPVGQADWYYEYDALGRMTYACARWQDGECLGDHWQYSYDGAGNLLLFDRWDMVLRETVTAQYVLDGANRVECIDDASGDGVCDEASKWQYDAYGNLLNDHVTQYTYDAAGRMSSTTIDGGTTIYTYNGDGERISQTYLARTTTYVLDVASATVLSATTDKGLANEETITYLNGLTTIAQSEVKPDGTTVSYLQYDGTGSVRQMTASDGLVRYSQTYDPYGNLYSQTDGNGSAIGFGGGSQDSNGLVYSGGRYYSPSRGLFVRQQLNCLGQSLSQSQIGREISQAGYNMQPMVAGAFHSAISYFNPVTWVRYNVDNVTLAINAYNAGERNLLKLYSHASGFTNVGLIGGSNVVNQLNADVPVVFRPGYRWYDRLPAATRIGGAAVGTGDLVAMAYFPIKGAVIRARVNAAANAAVAQRLATLDDFIGVESLRGGSISEIVARSRISPAYEPLAWEYEGLRVLEDVRYSALMDAGGAESVVRLDELGNNPYPTIVYEAEISPADYPLRGRTLSQRVTARRIHNRAANRHLYEAMQSDPVFQRQMMQDYPGVVDWVQPGPRYGFDHNSPPGWIWHHADEPGRLWLISLHEHREVFRGFLHPGNTGGFESWGIVR